jgi:modulator of FtsH protease HflC
MYKIFVGVVVLVILVAQSAFIVNEGEQGILLQFGKHVSTIQDPGLYFKIPMIQDFIVLDKRVIAAEGKQAEYITLDKKRLTVDTISRWTISEPLTFYQSVQNYTGGIARLNDIIFARLRQEIANHNFKEFIREERESIVEKVTQSTRETALKFGITVIDVRIKRVDLPEEVQASVFARMKAERERIAKRYRAEGDEQAREIRANAQKENEIIMAEAYKKAEVLRGQGDADATAIFADAYNKDPAFYAFLRHLEAYKKIFGADTTLMLRPDSALLRFLESPGPSLTTPSTPNALREAK